MDNLPEVGLTAVIENLKNFNQAAESIVKNYDEMAKGGDAVETSSLSLSGGLSGIASILSGVLVAAAAAAVAAIVALGASFAALSVTALNVAQDMEAASNAIIIGTGASGEALEEMEGIVKNLSESSAGVGHSYEDMGKVVAEVNTRLGLSGEELENASAAALKFSRVTGTDAVKSTQLATRVMGDWGIESENLGETLDTIFGASQAFGISTDALSQKVVQFGAPLRQMGFTLEESIALFGKWEKEGVNAELAIGSLRIAAGKFAKEGVDLRDGLDDVMQRIKGAATESEGLSIAMETFGARAGPDMAAAIREGRFELDSAIAALQNTDGALNDASERTLTFGDKMEIMWNKVRNSLLPFGDSMLEVADDLMPMLEDALVAIQPSLQEFAKFLGENLTKAAQNLIPWIQERLVPTLMDLSQWIINEGIPALVDFVGWIWNDVIPAAKEWYKWFKENIWPIIVDIAGVIKDDVIPAISDFVNWITKELIPAVKKIYKWIDKNLVPIFESLFKMFSKDGKKAGGVMSDIWDDIAKRIEPFIEEYLPELIDLWEEILQWTKRNWPKIQKIIEEVLAGIQKKIEKVLEWIEDFWEDWGETILDVTERYFGFIIRSIKRALETGMDIIEVFLDVLTRDWEGAWEGILRITARIGDQIKDTISTTFANIKDILSNVFGEMVEDAKESWNTMLHDVTSKFNEIKNAIASIWNTIKNNTINAISQMMQSIINTINQYASNISSTLQSVISSAVSALLSAVTGGSIASTLRSVGQAMINAIANAFATVTTLAAKLRDALTAGVQNVIDNLGNLGNALASIASAMISRIGSTLVSLYNIVATFIRNSLTAAAGSVWSAATGLISQLVSIGRNIINSIIDGIESNYYSVTNALRDIIEDLVEDALSYFGIGSPSKIFLGIGETLSDSLALGMIKGIPAIESAMSGITSVPLMSAPISTTSAAGQSIINNYNLGGNTFNTATDEAVFEARVMNVIRRNI